MLERTLSVRDVAIDFVSDGHVTNAVKNISFDLAPGRTLAIVGESGSGKSVTSQAIMGILSKNGRVTNGTIHFRDPKTGVITDITALDRDGEEMRKLRGGKIAMIFQEPMTSLSPLHTIGDQIGEVVKLHEGADQATADRRTADLLGKVGFRDPERALKIYPFELSGGMRQRAMIAMALVCNPAVLVADEPTTALDVTTQAQILELMRKLQREFKMAVLLITHDLGVVANMADDVVVMYRGEVMERGPVQDIFRDGRHDYLKALLRSIPKFGMKEDERLVPIRAIKSQIAAEDRPTGPRAAGSGRKVLEVTGVSKYFTLRSGMFGSKKTTIQALSNVSLAVPAGQTLGLVGESGSGKTTLSKIIMRAMTPDEGQIHYDAGQGPKDVAKLEGAELFAYRRAVQFVFQDPFSSLNPRMTCYELLSEPLRIHNIGTPEERFQRVKYLMEVVGLDVRQLRRYPHAFSGGQRQRLGLARALALKPSVLLCDEPTSALDVSVQAQILNLLKDLQRELDLSILFVSHNLAVVDYMAQEIAVMCRGHIVEQAPRAALFGNPQHPYTKALLAAVPEPDLDRPLDFGKVSGGFSNPAEWPAPFTIRPGDFHPRMAEVAPGHFVRIGEAASLDRAS
ncbi:MAG TPA: ABC transporter ATP-binding protein [Beijerinckiaceae bacterium]|nr:ABC transporter ATP-binding protein [Beijerinckiaceae bacterium]